MTSYSKLVLLPLIALSFHSSIAFAQSGSADPEFEGNAGAVIINGLRVIKRQDLDFGLIAPSLTDIGIVKTYRGRNNFVGAGSGNDTEWRGWQRLRQSGISRFNVGARLHVKPNQPKGNYVGTFTLTFEYE